MQKSAKLLAEETVGRQVSDDFIPIIKRDEIVKIAPIVCIGDWVMVMQFAIETIIALPQNAIQTNRGIVVGANAYTLNEVALGDMVLFHERSIVFTITPISGFYSGKRLAIISSKNLICKTSQIRFEVVEGKEVIL